MNLLLYCGFSSTQRKSFIKFHLCSHLIWHRLILNRGLAEDQCHNQFLPWAQVHMPARRWAAYLLFFTEHSWVLSFFEGKVPYYHMKKGKNGTRLLITPYQWWSDHMSQSIDQVLIRCFLHHMFLRNQVVVKLICSLFYWILKFNWCYF